MLVRVVPGRIRPAPNAEIKALAFALHATTGLALSDLITSA